MIRYLETLSDRQREELLSFCEKDVFGVKALGPVLSYGTEFPFVSAWEQRDEDEVLTAFLSKVYGTICLTMTPEANRKELLSFLPFAGFSALFAPISLFEEGMDGAEPGCVMTLEYGKNCKARTSREEGLTLSFDDAYKDFYEALSCSNPGYLTGTYEDFLTDFSHRVRHQTAHFVLLRKDGKPAATAAVLVETPNRLFLGGVSTLPEYRGRHYASTCIQALCERFPEHKVFLCCRPEKQVFYERLGFQKTDDYLEWNSSQK